MIIIWHRFRKAYDEGGLIAALVGASSSTPAVEMDLGVTTVRSIMPARTATALNIRTSRAITPVRTVRLVEEG